MFHIHKQRGSSFRQFVQQQQTAVYTLCYRLLGDPQAAEEAAQQTFLAVHDRYANISRLDLLAAACEHARSQHRRQPLPRPEPAAAESVQALLNELPLEDRVIVALRYCCRLSCGEIAGIVGGDAPAVRRHLHHARRRVADVVVQQQAAGVPG